MKSKFVLTSNSFNKFLGLGDDQMSQVKAGGYGNGGPYLPTAHPVEEWKEEHAYGCVEGYRWDAILGKCVPA